MPSDDDHKSNISNMTTIQISEETRQALLDSLQAETSKAMIISVVFLVILALVGTVGNSLVLIVYWRKLKKTATRVLIMYIAIFDLLTNLLVTPGEIYDIFHIWNFDNPHLCKSLFFLNAFTTVASAVGLLAVAVTRYRKVCHPFKWQISLSHCKLMCLLITFLAVVFVAPTAVLNGRQTKETTHPHIHAYECTIDDAYVDTIWPILNYGLLLLLFLSCCIPLIVLYVLIGFRASKHKKVYGVTPGLKRSTSATSYSSVSVQATRSTAESCASPKLGRKRQKLLNIIMLQTCCTIHSGSSTTDGKSDAQRMQLATQTSATANEARNDPRSGKNEQSEPQEIEHLLTTDQINGQNINEDEENVMTQSTTTNNDHENFSGRSKILQTTADIETEPPTERSGVDLNICSETSAKSIVAECKEDTVHTANCLYYDFDQFCYLSPSPELNRGSDSHMSEAKRISPTAETDSEQMEAEAADKGRDLTINKRVCAFADGEQTSNHAYDDSFNTLQKDPMVNRFNTMNTSSLDVSTLKSNKSANIKIMWPKLKKKRCADTSMNSPGSPSAGRTLGRTTFMLFLITIVYIVSYLPHLALMFFSFSSPEAFNGMTITGRSFYNLFLRFYFLNSAANPIIYSLCDTNFRRKCLKLVKCSPNSQTESIH